MLTTRRVARFSSGGIPPNMSVKLPSTSSEIVLSEKRKRDDDEKENPIPFKDFAKQWKQEGNEAGTYDVMKLVKKWVEHVTNANGCDYVWENLWSQLEGRFSKGVADEDVKFYTDPRSGSEFTISVSMRSDCFELYVGGCFTGMQYFSLFGVAKHVLDGMKPPSPNNPVVARCKDSFYRALTVVFPKRVKRTDPVVSEFLREFLRLLISEIEPILLRGFC